MFNTFILVTLFWVHRGVDQIVGLTAKILKLILSPTLTDMSE